MLELLFTIGQSAAALLLVYGGYLAIISRRAAPAAKEEHDLPVFLRRQLDG